MLLPWLATNGVPGVDIVVTAALEDFTVARLLFGRSVPDCVLSSGVDPSDLPASKLHIADRELSTTTGFKMEW